MVASRSATDPASIRSPISPVSEKSKHGRQQSYRRELVLLSGGQHRRGAAQDRAAYAKSKRIGPLGAWAASTATQA
jgi:hypothetical protein